MKRFKNGKSWFFIAISLFLSITGVLAQRLLAYRTQTQAIVPAAATTSDAEAEAKADSKKAAEELIQICQAYQKAGLMTCALQYELKSPESTRPVESVTGQMTLLGKEMHVQLEAMEFLQQAGQLLCIDHEEKAMILDLTGKTDKNPFNIAQMATFLDESGANALLETVDATQKKLDLDLLSSRVENLQIWYQTASHWMDKAQMCLPNLETGISDTLTVHFKEQTLSKMAFPVQMKRFVTLNKKTYIPTSEFKSYNLKIIK